MSMKEWTPEEIKNLRDAMNLSQQEFGQCLGVTRQAIYYIERGERKLSKILKRLLDCFEVLWLHAEQTEKGKEGRHGKGTL
jgi:DNA-binding transcriptional regulator YiaG